MSRAVGFWIALLLVFSGTMLIYLATKNRSDNASGSSTEQTADAGPMTEPRMEEFELIDQTGARFNSKQFDGQVWLGSFFFVSCPATCYQQNQKLQQLYAKYADQGLHVVSISCDPDNDTPVALAAYANRFNAKADNWKFLTTMDSDRKYLQKIGNEYLGI
ncbi:MAG: SCO family protein, partial [Planctomycetales bacterium]|nr:SCO family protein [Planctomycetales bacterium]